MAAFEYGSGAGGTRRDDTDTRRETPGEPAGGGRLDPRRLREEPVIALKVYDQCRWQDCLGDIGPARAAENKVIDGIHYEEGAVIIPPSAAASATVEGLRVRRVIIVEKKHNPFKHGFWDVDLKYVFEYALTFREADGSVIGTLLANNIYCKKLTLFGSVGGDSVLATDLFSFGHGESVTLEADPFILAEAKAVSLEAELRYRGEVREVFVTIGLFSVVQLFRIVQLSVESRGFAVPPECTECAPVNPCEFFERLDFPMDIFAPPQKPEFAAGLSGNIPGKREHKPE